MYKRILIPTDGSELSRCAIEHGVRLARALGAEVLGLMATPNFRAFHPLHATRPVNISLDEWDADAAAMQALDVLKRAAAGAGVRCEVKHVVGIEPHEAIIRAAREEGCDLICMASHRRKGVAALAMGSVATKVTLQGGLPVLICA